MPGPMTTAIGKTVQHVPGLRRVPVLKLLVVGELVMLAHTHLVKLEPGERRRLFELIRVGHGRTRNLSEGERLELKALIAKAEPRMFAGTAVNKLSPVSLPGRLLYGSAAKGKKRKAK